MLIAGCTAASPTAGGSAASSPAAASAQPATEASTSTPTPGPTPAPTGQPLAPAETSLPTAAPTRPPTTTPSAAAGTPAAVQPSAAPAASPTPLLTRTCKDQAVFVQDVTIPDNTLLEPGENFTKTWRFQNSGTCDWGAGYSLVFVGGDMLNSAPNTPLKVSVPAGKISDVSIDLQAPQRGGEHTGFWKIQNPEGQQFGTGFPDHAFWTSITVRFFTDNSGGDGTAQPGAGATPVSPGSGEANCAPNPDHDVEVQVLDLINTARTDAGLQPLTLQSQLTAAAEQHSIDMACHNYVDHTGSDGSTWRDRAAAQGYANAASARENIYVGDPGFGGNAQGAFNWWMNSDIHRANILYPDVSEIGIGYIYLPGSQYGGYYTTVFARP